ncbi:MAG: hypothetical protein BAJALOKI3v1_120044 [Promethearchaeota archaeon]|nr:MAG: hypothetical protein BAJALOKI3v1_120044 [Candidatus Lokiarchaeota archaeon]
MGEVENYAINVKSKLFYTRLILNVQETNNT